MDPSRQDVIPRDGFEIYIEVSDQFKKKNIKPNKLDNIYLPKGTQYGVGISNMTQRDANALLYINNGLLGLFRVKKLSKIVVLPACDHAFLSSGKIIVKIYPQAHEHTQHRGLKVIATTDKHMEFLRRPQLITWGRHIFKCYILNGGLNVNKYIECI